MSKSPEDALEEVVDEQSFIDFLQALANDRLDEVGKERVSPSSPDGSGCNGWDNGTIEDFLFAAAAWGTSSINGLPLVPKSTNSWRRCADIIYSGKIYE